MQPGIRFFPAAWVLDRRDAAAERRAVTAAGGTVPVAGSACSDAAACAAMARSVATTWS
jgi:hypothetical protein